jgi:hypothetical protein
MTAKGKKFHMLWSNRNLYKKSKPRVKLVASANTVCQLASHIEFQKLNIT